MPGGFFVVFYSTAQRRMTGCMSVLHLSFFLPSSLCFDCFFENRFTNLCVARSRDFPFSIGSTTETQLESCRKSAAHRVCTENRFPADGGRVGECFIRGFADKIISLYLFCEWHFHDLEVEASHVAQNVSDKDVYIPR